jgi:acetoin utilization protein AcuB
MFVSTSMTREVVALTPDESLLEARDLMRRRKVRHIPVVTEGNRLVGMISDRDVRSAMLSSLHHEYGSEKERKEMAKFKVKDVMTKEVIMLSLRGTIEDALLLFLKYGVGALPVVDSEEKLVGIVSVRDMLRSFVSVLGIGEPGTLVCLLVEDRLGEMKKIVDIIHEEKISIGSILVARYWDPGKRAVFPYLMSINVGPLKRKLQEAGYTLLEPAEWYLDDVKGGKQEEGRTTP